ncbi:MAG: hypothetical protein ACRDQH_13305 [Pseudonocardiaceae bacterium]
MIASTGLFSLNATLVAELVVFVLVVVIVAKVVAPALRRAMVERQRTIDDGLATAALAQDLLARAEAERRRILAEAQREGAEILAISRRMAADTETDARHRARTHYHRVVGEARREAKARLSAADERQSLLR